MLECLCYRVGHADEGVCLLVQMGPYRILLDCGLEDISPMQASINKKNPLPADLVLICHAHADHARGLLALHRAFPQLPIYASEVTTQLLPLNWPGIDRDQLPWCQALPWQKPIEFLDGLTAELFPAGHLPGAAAVLLTYRPPPSSGKPPRPYTVFYTGDFFLSNSRLVDGFPLEELRGLQPDVLIVEGSYGTSRLRRRRSLENELAERIHGAIGLGYSVLLPTPPLGLAQELLMLLRSHHQFTGRDLDIWVDGSVARGCDIYLNIIPHLPSSVQNFAKHQPLFWDERVRPRMRRFSSENPDWKAAAPSIVIADETADFNTYCQTSDSWLVLLPEKAGFPKSREISDRTTRGDRLQVETYLLAEHSDGSGTTQLVHNLRPQHVIFVHGSSTYLADLANLEELRNRYHLHTPKAGTHIELPVDDTLLMQPSVQDTSYQGELTEDSGNAIVVLPEDLSRDPRWQNFADTGLVVARWQGKELVLRGLSQRELLGRSSNAKVPPGVDCCGNCLYYRGQRCWNQASPLFGFKVTPDGYCPAFEAIERFGSTENLDEDFLEGNF